MAEFSLQFTESSPVHSSARSSTRASRSEPRRKILLEIRVKRVGCLAAGAGLRLRRAGPALTPPLGYARLDTKAHANPGPLQSAPRTSPPSTVTPGSGPPPARLPSPRPRQEIGRPARRAGKPKRSAPLARKGSRLLWPTGIDDPVRWCRLGPRKRPSRTPRQPARSHRSALGRSATSC
eukprot:2730449-Rhodomonas_salina.1